MTESMIKWGRMWRKKIIENNDDGDNDKSKKRANISYTNEVGRFGCVLLPILSLNTRID